MRLGDTVDHDIHERAVTDEVGRELMEIVGEDANMGCRINSSIFGNDQGALGVHAGGLEPARTALTNISRARPAVGGETTVAVSSPRRTHSWPVLVTPSHPVKGTFSQRSRSWAPGSSPNAFLAPMAMASFWHPTTRISSLRECPRDNQDLMA